MIFEAIEKDFVNFRLSGYFKYRRDKRLRVLNTLKITL